MWVGYSILVTIWSQNSKRALFGEGSLLSDNQMVMLNTNGFIRCILF